MNIPLSISCRRMKNLPEHWRRMLGSDWKEIHENWLHRPGNLTLTGYNSEYADKPFEEKRDMKGRVQGKST